MNMAMMVSIEMSIGRDPTGELCVEERDKEAEETDWRAECS